MSFAIRASNSLTEAETRDILSLCNISNAQESLYSTPFLSSELNVAVNIPPYYLGYYDDKLISFLVLFMPTFAEVEITAHTLPEYRNRGYFTLLLNNAKAQCAKAGFISVLYSVECAGKTAKAMLSHMNNVVLSHSEYSMTLNIDCPELKNADAISFAENLHVHEVTADNLRSYIEATQLVYDKRDNYAEGACALVNNPCRHGFVCEAGKEVVGLFHINCEGGESCIYGLAIRADKRGQGLGELMMRRAVNIARAYNQPVVLEVDSFNPPALHIYKKLGFEVTFQTDYYGQNI